VIFEAALSISPTSSGVSSTFAPLHLLIEAAKELAVRAV